MNTEKPRSFGEIARPERRRLLAMLVIRTSLSVAMLLLIYALLPAERTTTTDALGRLVAAVVFVALVIALQVHAIRSANHPVLRAIEAAINAICVFIIVFALCYLGLAQSNPANFSEPLNHISAFYYTVTILATVGFGDISAKSDVARLVVTVQMLLDLAIIAIIVRVFSSVARASRTRSEEMASKSSSDGD
jgi:voltage-gated potassium channel